MEEMSQNNGKKMYSQASSAKSPSDFTMKKDSDPNLGQVETCQLLLCIFLLRGGFAPVLQ